MEYEYTDDDKICVNCKYRDISHVMMLPVHRPWGWAEEPCAPCLAEACEADCGAGAVMLAEDGHCRFHADAFEPSEKFLGRLSDDAAIVQDYKEMNRWVQYA